MTMKVDTTGGNRHSHSAKVHPKHTSGVDAMSGHGDDDCVLLLKVWPRAGTLDALFHEQGEPKYTWQVIAETGGFSYNIWKHPKYKIALRGAVGEVRDNF